MAKILEKKQVVQPGAEGAVQAAVRQITGLPNATVRGMFEHGCVWVNGEVCEDPGLRLAAGSRLRVRFDPARKYRDKPKPRANRAFRMVFEDPHLVVVDKYPGVLTEPNKGETDTLVDYLANHLQRDAKQKRRPWVVHRLDRDTSGLLVLAKRREIAQAIKNQFRDRKPERVYIAIAAGKVAPKRGTFRSYLATDKYWNQFSTDDPNRGKLAVTHYEVMHVVEGATVVKVRLETGRRNQIRVHFAERDHPLLGDPRYESAKALHPLWVERRVALHAAVLGFVHPVTEEKMYFTSPLPEAFAPFFPDGMPRFDEAGPTSR